jgi:DNA-binding response OmpR family regulator
MFKSQEEQVAVLGICVDEPAKIGRHEGLNFLTAHSGRRAIDMLRMLSFDFLLVGTKLPDISVWDFLRHLKTAHPHCKWALIGGPISEQQEITARMFGATTLFDTTPSSNELLNLTARLREKAIANVLAGRFDSSSEAVGKSARKVRSAV